MSTLELARNLLTYSSEIQIGQTAEFCAQARDTALQILRPIADESAEAAYLLATHIPQIEIGDSFDTEMAPEAVEHMITAAALGHADALDAATSAGLSARVAARRTEMTRDGE